jgi:hypothetical protein
MIDEVVDAVSFVAVWNAGAPFSDSSAEGPPFTAPHRHGEQEKEKRNSPNTPHTPVHPLSGTTLDGLARMAKTAPRWGATRSNGAGASESAEARCLRFSVRQL